MCLLVSLFAILSQRLVDSPSCLVVHSVCFVTQLYSLQVTHQQELEADLVLALETLRRRTHTTTLPRPHADNPLMDSRLDAVVDLHVELGQLVVLVGRGLLDVSQRGGVDNVAHEEPLDGLVLGDGLAGPDAADALDVAAVVLVASVVAAFDCHLGWLV
jgi:hypothetical protein